MYYIEKSDSKWARIKEKAVDFLYPMSTYCVICGNAVDESRTYPICDHCMKRIRWGLLAVDLDKESSMLGRETMLDSASACMKYGLYEKELITKFKYEKKTYLARVIAKIMEDRIFADENLSEIILNCDLIVPVPVSPDRYRERGFNQTEKIGKHISKRLGIPVLDGLTRTAKTRKQAGLNFTERFSNIEGVFTVKDEAKSDLDSKKIILIDDVYTTGATAYHCAKELRKAGASEIHLLVLASSNDFVLEKSQKYV